MPSLISISAYKCKIPKAMRPYMLAFMLVVIAFTLRRYFHHMNGDNTRHLGIFATRTLFISEDILLVHCCNLAKCVCQSVSDFLLFRLMYCNPLYTQV